LNAACAQGREQQIEPELPSLGRHADHRRSAERILPARVLNVADEHGRRRAVLKHAKTIAETALGVDDHAHCVVAFGEPRRELWVVVRDGLGTDEYRIAQRAHAMQVAQIRGTGHIIRIARFGCDVAVEALSEVPDGQRRAGAHGAKGQI
jgi:hypothetical protein